MKSSLATQVMVLLAGLLLAGYACSSSRSSSHGSPDAAPGSSGGSATGGNTSASGGSATGGNLSTGGAPGTGGMQGSGGATGSGGSVTTGGTTASGGAATGGTVSTGGTRSTGGAGGTVVDGGGTTGCSCAGATTTFDCFCTIHSCTRTLSSFTADAGAGGGYSTLEEYANCNLVVVTIATSIAGGAYVFDRTTGRLVGERYESDVPDACPFGPDGSASYTLSAGQFPDTTCVRSKCVHGIYPALSTCPDAGI